MKAVIYCRVSTEDQAERGYSLESQERECQKFSLASSYEIDHIFVERGESAKTTNRTQLKKLIEHCVKNKKTIRALVIWKFDRLSRNLADQMELLRSFAALNIRILSVTENNDDTSSGKLMRHIVGAFAQFENDVKAERTTNGMKLAVQQGRWCWRAPRGYKNSRDSFNKTIIIPSDESKFIEETFELFKTGLHKQTDIAKKLRNNGFKGANKNFINRVLKNPVYMGMIETKWFPEPVPGIHKPIVSKETFDRVQAILEGRKPSLIPKERNNPNFPLRNFLKCPHCALRLTGSFSTGRKGVRYAYYHCRVGKCRINAKKAHVDKLFYQHLKSLQVKPNIVRLFEAIVIDVWKKKREARVNDNNRLADELKELEQKKDRIEELMINGTFDDETYKQKAQEVKTEIMIKRLEYNETAITLNEIEACLDFCKGFILNVADLWATAGLDLKQRFQQLVFPEGLTYEKNGLFRTAPISSIFSILQNPETDKSKMATPAGFEPASSP